MNGTRGNRCVKWNICGAWLRAALGCALMAMAASYAGGQTGGPTPQVGRRHAAEPLPRQPRIEIPLRDGRLPPSAAQRFAELVDSDPLTAESGGVRLARRQTSADEAGGSRDLQAIERRLGALEGRQRQEPLPRSETPIRTGFSHEIFGRIQADTVTFGQDPANISQVGHAPNGTDFRRVRMGIQGAGYEMLFYRLEVDFAEPSKVANFPEPETVQGRRPRITDAYIDVRKLPLLGTVRAGQFRVPLSIERTTSANNITFIERGLPQAFNPSRELGIMAFDHTSDYRFSWWNDLSTADSNSQAEQFGKAARLDITDRLVCLPWYDEPSGGRYLFQMGAAYEYQNSRNVFQRYASTPEAILQFGDQQIIPTFVNTGTFASRDNNLVQVEASTVLGPLSIQGEYYAVFVNQTAAPAAYLHGAYVFVSYFLTGENRVYNRNQGIYDMVTPFANFFRLRTADREVATGPGAWEIAARFSTINLTDRNLQGGTLNDFTLGVNWYLNSQMRVMANWIHASLNRQNLSSNADVFLTRAQVVW